MSSPSPFPRAFGRYTLVQNLAQGGMGALYLSCVGEPGLERACVIKTVLPQLADKEYVARFRDEAKVVVKLSHGNLVPVFDAGTAGGISGEELFLAMDYIDGKDLRAVWNRCARKGIAFPVDIAVYIARELARGLQHAHTFSSLKLVHRDVSPPNVLLSFFGEIKLTDFGLASSVLKTEKTAPGVVYGKVSYMSPEQARSELLDGRTDLYAVGIILWELLTGRQLFPQSEANLIDRVRDPRIESPSYYAPRVPPALDAIVMKALAKDKTLRFADCEAFRSALAGFLAQTAPTTDTARMTGFLHQLFEGEIEDDRRTRTVLVEEGARWAAEQALKKQQRAAAKSAPSETRQSDSQPRTLSLQPVDKDKREPGEPVDDKGIIGTYIDGRYLIRRLIGEGGMGLVYEAEHVEIGRRVAVKVLHAMYTRQNEVVARFRSEARAATRIGHPNIIDVFDSGTTVDGAVYFVMEFLEGRDLSQTIEDDGALLPQRAMVIARDICMALMAAHKANILHRDLKPENVFLIHRDGNPDFVKVLDFGIAKTMEELSERVGRLTGPGVAMGTPEYMAPEQAAGQPIDARADVYAVGAILYEMLSGRPPHEGQNVMEVLTRKATVAPTPVELLRPDVPRELAQLVMRTLAISPDLRPQSMESMASELTKLCGPMPTTSQPSLVSDRVPRKRTPEVAAAVAVAALLGGAGLWWFDRSHPPPSERIGTTARSHEPPARRPEPPRSAAPPVSPPPVAPAPVEAVAAEPAAPSAALTPSAALATAPAANIITVEKPVVVKPPEPALKSSAPSPGMALAEARRVLLQARAALFAERFGEAEELFNRVRASGLERGASLTGLAEIAFQQGRFPEAVRLATRAIDADGDAAGAHMVRGNSYFRLGRFDKAAEEYRAVLQIDGSSAEARAHLAEAERRRGG